MSRLEIHVLVAHKIQKNRFVNFFSDGIELKGVTVNPTSMVTLKDVEDKLGQLIREVGKLQEQLTAMSPHANGNLDQDRTHPT